LKITNSKKLIHCFNNIYFRTKWKIYHEITLQRFKFHKQNTTSGSLWEVRSRL
jgi:hypothetical protein